MHQHDLVCPASAISAAIHEARTEQSHWTSGSQDLEHRSSLRLKHFLNNNNNNNLYTCIPCDAMYAWQARQLRAAATSSVIVAGSDGYGGSELDASHDDPDKDGDSDGKGPARRLTPRSA